MLNDSWSTDGLGNDTSAGAARKPMGGFRACDMDSPTAKTNPMLTHLAEECAEMLMRIQSCSLDKDFCPVNRKEKKPEYSRRIDCGFELRN